MPKKVYNIRTSFHAFCTVNHSKPSFFANFKMRSTISGGQA
jgi:hypothetical protein